MGGRLRLLGEHPSALLLLAQLVAVLAYPFLDQAPAGRAMLGVVGTVVVLLALAAVRRTPALTWIALLLGVPALVTTVWEAMDPTNDALVLVNALLHAPFYFVVSWGFAYVYAAAQVIWPGSFTGASGGTDRSWFELLFLSFTTLTSVGLSDVTPVLAHARSLVMVEQVAGVMYVALVVARLVGLTVARGTR